MSCPNHTTSRCVVDNAGLCHFCGRPMNFDFWLAAIGPEAYMNPDAYTDEWKALCLKHQQTIHHGFPQAVQLH